MTLSAPTARRVCLTSLAGAGGCSSSSSSGSSGGGSGAQPSQPTTTTAAAAAPAAAAGGVLPLAAVESNGLSFAGKVTIKLTNPGSNKLPHAIAIQDGSSVKAGQTASPGGTSSVTVTLKPGT